MSLKSKGAYGHSDQYKTIKGTSKKRKDLNYDTLISP